MKTVWLVTEGEYSAYGIRAVFSSKEAAERYAQERRSISEYDPVYVEEWPVDTEAGKIKGQEHYARISLETGAITQRWDDTAMVRPNDRSCVLRWSDKGLPEHPCLLVTSTVSAEHAEKVAVEKRQEWLRTEGAPK